MIQMQIKMPTRYINRGRNPLACKTYNSSDSFLVLGEILLLLVYPPVYPSVCCALELFSFGLFSYFLLVFFFVSLSFIIIVWNGKI